MASIEPTSPVLCGVQITQEPPPKSPFASPGVGSPFVSSPATSNGNPAAAAATPSPTSHNRGPIASSPQPSTVLSIGPDGSPGPEINPLTGSPETSNTATRQVSWNISRNTVREYEISETQPSEDDWEYRQFRNCCCSIQ
ncbi:hypothetical protein Ndes2526B_g07479 [Nannochloris sp. 'desiccata']|nr:hypothetical protein NADE_004022 [Chlorella desiccata (nom. nud.)]KAH7622730.1 hypothetical protein NADE_005310 [Chlorella desiccata (nom. nud.)]